MRLEALEQELGAERARVAALERQMSEAEHAQKEQVGNPVLSFTRVS